MSYVQGSITILCSNLMNHMYLMMAIYGHNILLHLSKIILVHHTS
jgi:hypothetical protein